MPDCGETEKSSGGGTEVDGKWEGRAFVTRVARKVISKQGLQGNKVAFQMASHLFFTTVGGIYLPCFIDEKASLKEVKQLTQGRPEMDGGPGGRVSDQTQAPHSS